MLGRIITFKRSAFTRLQRRRLTIKVHAADPKEHANVPVLAEFVTEEGAKAMKEQVWPKAFGEDFKGQSLSVITHYPLDVTNPDPNGYAPPQRLMWIGLGKQARVELLTFHKATTAAVSTMMKKGFKEGTIMLDLDQLASLSKRPLNRADIVRTVVSTAVATNYAFDKYLHEKKKRLETLKLSLKNTSDIATYEQHAKVGAIFGQATNYARDLVNERGNVCTPEYMEEEARKLVAKYPALFELEILQIDELKKKGLNLLVAVGQASKVPPRLVLIRYKGDPTSTDNHIALVGKGITFDTGGLHIKPGTSMDEMYTDMSGAAAVLAALSAFPALKFKQNIVGVLCLAENSVGSASILPSSIIKSYHGLTVEIDNTDAEGRLVLADGLTYVQRHYKTPKIVDLATLTGACIVALGKKTAGMFSNTTSLPVQMRAAADKVFERVWHLPIGQDHMDDMKGKHSDLVNAGKGRSGGACTAAAFLKKFIYPKYKWLHLDIAGPATSDDKFASKGATGFGTQLLLQWISNLESQPPKEAKQQ